MSFFTRKLSKQDSTPTHENRKSSAMDDPEWKSILDIKHEVLKAWRLPDKGPAIPVPDDQVGFFFNDQKYVVLKTFNHNRKMAYNLHFWMGKEAAAKASPDPPEKVAQVMALLDGKVVLFREIEENESPVFMKYFRDFGIFSGGDGGIFDPENPQNYRRRLLHFHLMKDGKRVNVTEVHISRQSLGSGDVYILDEGTKMIQWNGSRCDDEERISARKYIENALKQRKTKCTSEFFDEEDLLDVNELYTKLGNAPVPPRQVRLSKKTFQKKMFRLSDETKKLVLNPVYTGKVYRNGINPDDVTFLDTLRLLYVYIGPGANENERNSAWPQADKYLKEANTPYKAIAVFTAGSYCPGYDEVWDDRQE
ncbi:unnamed protein product [Mesocestoides corti]|uniref:Gelsolin-like domain-containing protein n=1 Tax=Mesocestoides corti TaxID=53468 RepID=A0A0R3U2S7_MESCO|nr:unnamed protein product [Mesocestoides corti]